jgi:hypothetical protein
MPQTRVNQCPMRLQVVSRARRSGAHPPSLHVAAVPLRHLTRRSARSVHSVRSPRASRMKGTDPVVEVVTVRL